MSAAVRQLTIHQLAIPMKVGFSHALHTRAVAQPVLVEAELYDGTTGYGETHPRDYVTGETLETVPADIQRYLLEPVVAMSPDCFAEALEKIGELPFADPAGRCINAARAAVELALLDAYSRHFGRSIDEVAGWLGLAGFGPPGSGPTARYSGVLGSDSPSRVVSGMRKQRLFGLRHFKLKVGMPGEDDVVAALVKAMGRRLADGKMTLRLDANAGWSFNQAVETLTRWRDYPIASVEQPVPPGEIDELARLSQTVPQPIMADESLITYEHGQSLAELHAVNLFNIRLSKNGGLMPAVQLASLARQHGLGYQLGCMVGETSILSAAGRRFVQLVPDIRFVEGGFGRFLLRDDVVTKPVRFGYGGRLRVPSGPGWGIQVRADKLATLADVDPIRIPL